MLAKTVEAPLALTSAGKRESGRYLPSLDGWRAIAILSVIIFHDAQPPRLGPIQLSAVHTYGGLGVDLFFAISGLLIVSRLLDEERKHGKISIKGFYTRRAFRILPPSVCYLAALLALKPFLHIAVNGREIFSCLVFVRNYAHELGESSSGWYTGHFWSLSVEEQFYLIVPGLLVLARTQRRRLAIAAILTTAFAAWAVFGHYVFPGIYTALHYGEDSMRRTEMRVHGIFMGALWALLLRWNDVQRWVKAAMRPWVVFAVMVLSAFLLLKLQLPRLTLLVLLQLSFSCLLVATITHPKSVTSRILELAPLRFVGHISYSLYLWQQLFFYLGKGADRGPSWANQWPWSFLGAFACACVSYYFIEKPMIRMGQKAISRLDQRSSKSLVACDENA
ncbi:MAG TPA: acyltransferase [Terracidiphilus sp.]|nr:acyltransferase [Terracidiphilus sp.]